MLDMTAWTGRKANGVACELADVNEYTLLNFHSGETLSSGIGHIEAVLSFCGFEYIMRSLKNVEQVKVWVTTFTLLDEHTLLNLTNGETLGGGL